MFRSGWFGERSRSWGKDNFVSINGRSWATDHSSDCYLPTICDVTKKIRLRLTDLKPWQVSWEIGKIVILFYKMEFGIITSSIRRESKTSTKENIVPLSDLFKKSSKEPAKPPRKEPPKS